MSDRPPREPLFNVPAPILGLLLVMTLVHLVRLAVSTDTDFAITSWLTFVPIRLTALFDGSGVASRVGTWAASAGADDARRAALADFFLHGVSSPVAPTVLTYAFLHGGWAHLGLNAVWLLAFGTPLARRLGAPRFLSFLAVTAVAGAIAHWICFPFGTEPVLGASAAVSGCMGAALRFAFGAPKRLADQSVREQPVATLSEVLRNRGSLAFLLVWFVSNALFGIGSTAFGLSDEPVAWQAHIGGFLAGLFLLPWFDRRAPVPPNQPEELAVSSGPAETP